MRGYCCLILFLGVLGGCASSRLILERPLTDHCKGLSLRGCAEITDGVLAYVDGDQATGDAKLEIAVEANGEGRMREFAEKLRQLEDLPGSDSFMEPLRRIIAKLEGPGEEHDADADPPRPHPRSEAPRRARRASASKMPESDEGDEDEEAEPFEPLRAKPGGKNSEPAMVSDAAHYVSGTVMATRDATGGACETPITSLSGVNERSMCTKAVSGPIVLTDLYVGGGCPAELMLVIGDFSAWRLVLPVPSRTAVHQTAARISVGPLEHLAVVALKRGDSEDPRCAVTWTGWKP